MAQFKVLYGTQLDGDAEPRDIKEVIVVDVATMAHAAWVTAEVVFDCVHPDGRVLIDVIRLS